MCHAILSLVSLLALSAVFAVQNIFLLTSAPIVFLYETLGAAELYASACFLYFSLRFFEEKRDAEIRWLFPKVFSVTVFYSLAVLLNCDFNSLAVLTSLVCFLFACAGCSCVLFAFAFKKAVPQFPQSNSEFSLFSARECEVIDLILQGKTTQETADCLFISLATVKTHLQHIYDKANVRNRAELARFVQNHPNG